jgi:hypothetical protein
MEMHLQKAQEMIAQHTSELAALSSEISTVGCSWCGLGCSGIVGD